MGEKKKVRSVFYCIGLGIFGTWAVIGLFIGVLWSIAWLSKNQPIPGWIWIIIIITLVGGVLGNSMYKDNRQKEEEKEEK